MGTTVESFGYVQRKVSWFQHSNIEHLVLLYQQLEAIEERIQQQLEPYRPQFELLLTIPGMKDLNAAAILAEIGPSMETYQTAARICSWARICPGKQAGWAAARKRESVFQRKFHRWVNKLGKKKANVAIARSLLTVAFTILRNGQPYHEPDLDQLHNLERQKLIHHHARRHGN